MQVKLFKIVRTKILMVREKGLLSHQYQHQQKPLTAQSMLGVRYKAEWATLT